MYKKNKEMKIKMEKFEFFWKSDSPFSQWYKKGFKVKGKSFNCAEQYMMYMKAVLFGDEIIAAKILEAKSPREQKDLGRKVKNFNKDIWERQCKNIVYNGNYAKFTQNEGLKSALLETKGKTLVEASPYDTIWGIGLSEENPDSKRRSKWRGKNYLGEILTQLREDILKEEGEKNGK